MGQGTGLQINRSWSMGKALDYRSIGYGLCVRYCSTDLWSRDMTLEYNSLGRGLGARDWNTDYWVMTYGPVYG